MIDDEHRIKNNDQSSVQIHYVHIFHVFFYSATITFAVQ